MTSLTSVIQAMRAMERCDVVLLLCDAAEGVAEQDAKILGLAVDRGRAIVVGLNKTDQMDKQELAKAEDDARDKLSFIPWAPAAGGFRLRPHAGGQVRHLAPACYAETEMSRFDHVIRVARLLQKLEESRAGGPVRAIAEELEVSDRTAYRYLEAPRGHDS